VKIRVEGHADPCLGQSAAQNLAIISAAHADVGHMDRIPTRLSQQSG
jgi:hypothetical protein